MAIRGALRIFDIRQFDLQTSTCRLFVAALILFIEQRVQPLITHLQASAFLTITLIPCNLSPPVLQRRAAGCVKAAGRQQGRDAKVSEIKEPATVFHRWMSKVKLPHGVDGKPNTARRRPASQGLLMTSVPDLVT